MEPQQRLFPQPNSEKHPKPQIVSAEERREAMMSDEQRRPAAVMFMDMVGYS
jgi:hypothetical protein